MEFLVGKNFSGFDSSTVNLEMQTKSTSSEKTLKLRRRRRRKEEGDEIAIV